MTYYFLYKPINISSVGGVFPNIPDDKIKFGITENDGYYLGSTEDPVNIELIKPYFVTFIKENQANGFKILNNDKIYSIDNDTQEITSRDLTTEELNNQNLAKKLMLKFKLRPNLETVFSDIPDMLAEANKKNELIERMFMELMLPIIKGETISSALSDKYLPLIQMYNDKLANNEATIRADIENDLLTFYTNLVNETNTLNQMVNDLYLSMASS